MVGRHLLRFVIGLVMSLAAAGAVGADTGTAPPFAADGADQGLVPHFLAVLIQWRGAKQDVDLQVEDPSGAVFSFARRTVAGRPGELSVDTTRGPGVELWEAAPAPAGDYKVYFNYYASHGNSEPVSVKGVVYSRQGRLTLPDMTLTRKGERRLAATLRVTADGVVSIR